jgi:hypothetical protein
MGDEIENANVIRVQTLPLLVGQRRPQWNASLGPTGAGAIHAIGSTPEAAVRKLLDRIPQGWPWDESWREKRV